MKKLKRKKIKMFKRIKIPIKIRILLITFLGIILIISAFSTYASYKEPTTTEERYTTLNFGHSGIFNYVTYLKNNSVYDNKTALYPNEGTIFKQITENISASFTYYLKFSNFQYNNTNNPENSDIKINISGNYNIQAEIQTILWNKTYTLIPTTSFNSNEKTASFRADFPIDISFYEDVLTIINSETGIITANPLLFIKCNIATITKTDKTTIYDSFSPSINLTLNKNTIEISENLSFYQSGSRTDIEKVFNQGIVNQRENQTLISIFFLILFFITLIITKNKIEIVTKTEKMIKKINKKYGEWIVKVENPLKIPNKSVIIKTKSFDDLVKIGEELGKPIFYHSSKKDNKNTFYVFDDKLIYKFFIKNEEKVDLKFDLKKETNKTESDEEIEMTIVELLKEDVPYNGIRSQLQYKDNKGKLKFPRKSFVNKIRKKHIDEINNFKEKREMDDINQEIMDFK